MSSRRQVRAATDTLTATGNASASVIAARMLAFSDPTQAGSAWHQAEAQRMVQEKCDATGEGMVAAGMQLAMLPMRMWQLTMRPSSWTPAGAGKAWMDAAGLWLGVGTAALQPARRTAVRNRTRLAGRTG
jgi:hypothetical protein